MNFCQYHRANQSFAASIHIAVDQFFRAWILLLFNLDLNCNPVSNIVAFWSTSQNIMDHHRWTTQRQDHFCWKLCHSVASYLSLLRCDALPNSKSPRFFRLDAQGQIKCWIALKTADDFNGFQRLSTVGIQRHSTRANSRGKPSPRSHGNLK